MVEREFQTAIEACIDIGEMLLRSHGGAVPDTNLQFSENSPPVAPSRTKQPTEWLVLLDSGTCYLISTVPISTIETSSTVCRINSTLSRNTSRKSGYRSSKSVDRTITL